MKNLAIALFIVSSAIAAEVKYEQQIHISAPPAAVWKALVTPDIVKTWHFAPLKKLELKKGGVIAYGPADKESMISGKITEVIENEKLAHTFHFGPESHHGTAEDPDTAVTYTLKPEGDGTQLTLLHTGFPAENQSYANITGGWPFLLKQLKEAVETLPK